ncbi:MAG: hypothetical protein K2X53_03220 [Alphaproteobacteria bacterium]|nr:hypothetical protein [Alphaproteobacteria bacterium]
MCMVRVLTHISDRVFLHPPHIIVEVFKNTSRLRAPELSVNAKTIENGCSITGSTLTPPRNIGGTELWTGGSKKESRR